MNHTDTIAAIATPPGKGGVGVIRISGPGALEIASQVSERSLPDPGRFRFSRFLDAQGETIDEGLILCFRAPNSFTGEDVVEFQGHGGPMVLDLLLRRVLRLGARMAQPGEFSQRAFLNDRIDLAQAEAIADLIESTTEQAARSAVRSLEGVFSQVIHELVEQLIALRMYVEAAIDFAEEEIDFLGEERVSDELLAIGQSLEKIQQRAHQGKLLRDGMTLVIAGAPNAGKSSLLNALAGRDTAIVTDIPGTTRDLLRERIEIDGMPLHLVDTAGLRDSSDPVEQEGIRRAREQINLADRILWIFDDVEDPQHAGLDPDLLPEGIPLTLIRNKIDRSGSRAGLEAKSGWTEIALSARSGEGLGLLREHLKHSMGYHSDNEGDFIARRRHLDALERAGRHLSAGRLQLEQHHSGELLAEELRLAQQALSEITGEFAADDLLGRIFSSFCIGK